MSLACPGGLSNYYCMYIDLPYLLPKRKDISFASLSIALSHGHQWLSSLYQDSESRHSELKECEGNVRSRGHHLGGVGKGVHSRPQPSTKRTSSVLASISSVWNVIGGSRDLCVPGSFLSSYIIAELPKPPILDSLVSFSTTPISRCDCPTTGNIARYPGGGVFRHYRTSPSTSNKGMYNCLMRCAYKVCLPYGCALHDPIGTKPRMIFSAPHPIGGRRITYHRGLSSLFGVTVEPLTTLPHV